MRSSTLLLSAAISAASASNIPANVGIEKSTRAYQGALKKLPNLQDFAAQASGFHNPHVISSVGGHAICIQGTIPIHTSATNVQLNLTSPVDELDLTNIMLEYLQIDSPFVANQMMQGSSQVSGSYSINSKICFPREPQDYSKDLPLQFLIHGVGFDKNYWDFYSEDYSYVDYMAKVGYTTFSYDRLGVGLTDKPDPIQTVQSSLQVSIAHTLIQKLRNGDLASRKFKKVVGVGHSFGSIQINALTKSYPQDLDAAVLTGFSTSTAGIATFLAAMNLGIASKNQPNRFPKSLPNGYTVLSTAISNQMVFFRYPNFDPKVLAVAEKTKWTFTLGELITLTLVSGVAEDFKGPVDVVNGENDLGFCQSNCGLPIDQSQAVLDLLYPAMANGSQTFMVKGDGHAFHLHYNAMDAYAHTAKFLNDNGL